MADYESAYTAAQMDAVFRRVSGIQLGTTSITVAQSTVTLQHVLQTGAKYYTYFTCTDLAKGEWVAAENSRAAESITPETVTDADGVDHEGTTVEFTGVTDDVRFYQVGYSSVPYAIGRVIACIFVIVPAVMGLDPILVLVCDTVAVYLAFLHERLLYHGRMKLLEFAEANEDPGAVRSAFESGKTRRTVIRAYRASSKGDNKDPER